MPWQFVYTSTPTGLVPGRSGFCVVARHRAIPESLVPTLERISVYEPLGRDRPVIFNYRLLQVTGNSYGVLSRYCDAGLDYTSRRNYLVHHLVFTAAEMPTFPPPAEVARRWTGWISSWETAPRWLDDADAATFANLQQKETTLPCNTWGRISNDAANALLPCPDGIPVETTFSLRPETPTTETILQLFAESALLLHRGPWSCGFATQAQQTDIPAQMLWRATNNPEALPTTRNVLTLPSLGPYTEPSPLAKIAREGLSAPPTKKPRIVKKTPTSYPTLTSQHTSTTDTKNMSAHNTNTDTGDDKAIQTILPGGIKLLATISAISLALLIIGTALLWSDKPDSPKPPKEITGMDNKKNTPSIHASTTFQESIRKTENLRREIDAAISKDNWLDATELLKKHQKQHPALAQQLHQEYWPRIKIKLAAAHITAFQKQMEKAASESFIPPQSVTALRRAHNNALTEIKTLNIETTPQTTTALKENEALLTFLESLPSTAPIEIAFLNWLTPPQKNQTHSWDHPGHIPLPSPKLSKLLAEPTQNPLSLSLDTINTCTEMCPRSESKITPTQTATLELNNEAARITTTPKKQRITIYLTEKRSGTPPYMLTRTDKEYFRLERNSAPHTQAPFETLLRSHENLRLTVLRKTSKQQENIPQESVTFFLISPQKPPTPLTAPLSLLVETRAKKTSSIAPPEWLVQTLKKRFPALSTHETSLALIPKEDLEYAPFFNGTKLTLKILTTALNEAKREASSQALSLREEIQKYEKSRQTASLASLNSIETIIALKKQQFKKIETRIEKIETRQKRIETQSDKQALGKNTPYVIAIRSKNGKTLNVFPIINFE
ncbi:MAG: hypothetical protein LBD01_06600 [Puniceicoccales bacterium]|jgi:hypothetical protein|nr:hypothetical protein [Puniceicoccales bacterium]